MDEDVAEYTLNQAAGKDKPILVEVKLESSRKNEISIKSGQVHNVSASTDAGMYVRVVMKEGIGFASANRIAKTTGSSLARTACRLAKAGRRKERVRLSSEKTATAKWTVKQRSRLRDVSNDDRLRYLKSLDSEVMSTGVKVYGRYFELADSETESYFASSEGARVRSMVPRLRMACLNTVSSGGETEQSIREWGATGGWERSDEWNAGPALAEEMKVLKNLIDNGKAVKPGEYDLVCGSEVAGIAAHESCGHPMEADRILGREMSQAGKSFVSPSMLGEMIGSEHATVIDDPTVPGSYGYYEYDDEGVKAKPRFLYKKGSINEFLHNRETAGKLRVNSNASSRSSVYEKEPIVRMANTFVAPGDLGEDEIVKSVKDGVFMKSFTEWNIDDKRYNQKYVSREAYFIRNGEIAGPARGCVLEITTPRFWKSLDGVSKKVEFTAAECGKGDPIQGIAVHTGGPLLRLKEVRLR
ncbi:MAG: TldD/PmbA family protein [Methanobacteriota archaeon]|nr:MAG: TldD/PmbA family protein [Euryarchaeota archaeon]